MAVPNTFATLTGPIPLQDLDTNFATPIIIGTTSIVLGDEVSTISDVILSNPSFGTTSASTLAISGEFGTTLTVSGPTAVTLPQSGNLLSSVATLGSVTGTPTILTFLRGDGTWSTPAGAGTVTYIAQSFTGGLISVSGSPITGAGTLALTVAGASGGIPYFSSTSTWDTSTTLVANALVIGGGAGAAPLTIGTGTSGNALISAGTSAPAFGNLALGTANTNVSGALTATNGGTGNAGTLTGFLYGNSTSAQTVATTAQALTLIGAVTGIAYGNGTGALTAATTAQALTLIGILPVANGGTGATTLTGANIVTLNNPNTYASLQTFSGSTSVLATVIANAAETTNIVGAAPSSTTNVYLNLGAVQFYTSNATNNWVINIAFSSTTSLNTALAVGQTTTIAVLTTQGGTAYYNTSVTIDGAAVTPKWQGGFAPVAGNISGIDGYSYTVTKTGSATYVVLASQTRFS